MQENRELYVKTRDAFRKAWFSLPTNKPCSYYTRDVLGEALAASREIESNKVKAASVMVHVLDFANWAEPKFNPKPDFTWQDLMEYTKGPLRKTEQEEVEPTAQESASDAVVETDADMAPSNRYSEGGRFAAAKTAVQAIEEKKEHRSRGRAPHPYAQIDPKTLKVVKVWPSASDAERELGANNLSRCAKLLRQSVGFYWALADADNVLDFKKRLVAKRRAEQQKAKQQEKKKQEKKKPVIKQKNMSNSTYIEEEDEREVRPAAPSRENSTKREIPDWLYDRLDKLGIIPNVVRGYNVGTSDYSQHIIQPWAIWIEYNLNPFDADILKRLLRIKATDPRKMDYEKIIHICKERIRQLEKEKE